MALGLVMSAAAQTKTVPSHLNAATVFFNGAELTHTASAALQRGESELTIEGLSPSINLSTISIKASGGVIISSWEFSVDYLNEAKRSETTLKYLEDSLKVCTDALNKVNADIAVNQKMSGMLQTGVDKNVSGSEEGLETDELAKTMSYYKTTSGELYNELYVLQTRRSELRQTLSRLNSQIAQEKGGATKALGVLRLNVTAPTAVTGDFTVKYVTSLASWTPYYDVNIASSDEPIGFVGKATVQQETGMDWNRVDLTLSTATPRANNRVPVFSAWFLEEPQLNRLLAGKAAGVVVADQAPVSEEMVLVRGVASIAAGAEPMYVVDGRVMSAEEFGTIDRDAIKSIDVLKAASATSMYGSRAANGVVVVTLKGMTDYVTTSDYEAPVLSYHIELPYTIPGNGKARNIELRKIDARADYEFYSAPKLDTRAYLIAQIPEWQALDLLSGVANITYDGTYVGQTMIDPASTQAELSLTLGNEERIVVQREKLRDFSSVKSFGSRTEQVFAYRITVRNNLNRTVKIVTEDQFPISTQKDIEVTLNQKETTPWVVKKDETGVLTWEEEFAPGQVRTYTINYTVRYPKGMNLNL